MTRQVTFTFDHVGNMIFCTSDCGIVWYAWHEDEFTKRKQQNAIARIKAGYNDNVVFVFNV